MEFFEGIKSIIGFYVAGVSFLYHAFRGQKIRYRTKKDLLFTS